MTSFSHTLSTKCRNALLAGIALSVLLTPGETVSKGLLAVPLLRHFSDRL